jgi:hypothetical protein
VDFKKNIFWIVIVLVLVLGIGGYVFMTSSIQSESGKTTDTLIIESQSKIEDFDKRAKKIGDKNSPDQIINAEHVRLAGVYKQRVEDQIKQLQDTWKSKKLDIRFSNVPTDSLAFDSWLNDFRERITKQAAAAGVQLPPDADKLMFKEPSTSDASEDSTRHRAYRLRQVAVIEEIVGVLCKKYGRQQRLKFEREQDKAESAETVDVGAVAIEKITILPSKNMVGSRGTPVMVAEDRMKAAYEDALKRANRSTAIRGALPSELPLVYTSVDVQFVAPLSTVPPIVQALESSSRYTAVVSRLDFQRATNPFPTQDSRVVSTIPGQTVYHNTHYQEAPVRALVSFDLYEYDAGKEAAANAAAAAPAKTDTKGKTDTKKSGR